MPTWSRRTWEFALIVLPNCRAIRAAVSGDAAVHIVYGRHAPGYICRLI